MEYFKEEEEEHKYGGLTIASWVGIGISIMVVIAIIVLVIYVRKDLKEVDKLKSDHKSKFW